jgi:hypothetical protein
MATALSHISDLAGLKGLGKFALESVFADPGAVKLPHDKPILFNEIAHCLIFVFDPLKPLVLIHVTLNNIFLSINDVMQMFALVKHGSIHPYKMMIQS